MRRTTASRPDRGAASLEWIGSVVVAAIVVAAVCGAVLADSPLVGQHVRSAICELLTLGQGSCRESVQAGRDRRPQEPCVRSTNGETLSLGLGVVIVEGRNGYAYEVAELGDGRYRVRRFRSDGLGVGTGVGAGATVTWKSNTYGLSAMASANAVLEVREGETWYVASEDEADALVTMTRSEAAKDLTLGNGPARWVLDAGEALLDLTTGYDRYQPPVADERTFQGGVVLNASAEAFAADLGGNASLGTSTALGFTRHQDGRTTAYLKSTVSGEIRGQVPSDDPGDPYGGKARGDLDLITAVTFDASGAMTDLSVRAVAAGQSSGVVASLFKGEFGPNMSNNANRTDVFEAKLPISTDEDRRIANQYLATAGVTQLGVGNGTPFMIPAAAASAYATSDLVAAAAERGDLTRQSFSTSSDTYGASAAGKFEVELAGSASYDRITSFSTGASYWDGTAWVNRAEC